MPAFPDTAADAASGGSTLGGPDDTWTSFILVGD